MTRMGWTGPIPRLRPQIGRSADRSGGLRSREACPIEWQTACANGHSPIVAVRAGVVAAGRNGIAVRSRRSSQVLGAGPAGLAEMLQP